MKQLLVPYPELGFQRLPSDELLARKHMQPVRQSEIDVEGCRVVADRFDRGFLKRDWVLLQLLEEAFTQFGCLEGQPALPFARVFDEKRSINDALVHQPDRTGALNVEGQTAAADAFSL